ncbi:hypothetical protein BDK88_2103 [Natrinema hispanicum]|uniref:Sulfatase n=1 Tax=Natrinema hispanicum TaxID=392421 RepID=A0A482Y9H1_9EURY|nr:hypothetical protein [Natrinema hispanicum]RZV10897.1 hypothetical protein BDK88_2103 [Natrinema hispanicum]
MYTSKQILAGVKNPQLLLSEINRLYTQKKNGCRYNPRGIDVFSEDWDNLLIFDACRFDTFEDIALPQLPGKLESRTSRASTSSEFIRGNFSDKQLYDTVYISANGWFAKLKDDINASVHDFRFVERDAANGLTSKPETVADAIREAAKEYPNKRLIGHFMQPHQPYLGDSDFDGGAGKLERVTKLPDVSQDDVIQAYEENLNLVVNEVDSLLDELKGRTVITADHGEIFGQRGHPIPVKRYGHPEAHYLTDLVKVPWHILEGDERKDIVADSPEDSMEEIDFDQVEQNLADLGYTM